MDEKIKSIIESGFVYEKLETIGDKFNLKLDQVGQLNADLEMFLYGKIKSSEILDVISKNIDVSGTIVEDIWKEIDLKILGSIKKQIQDGQNKPEEVSPIPEPLINPTLEQAGQFTIEKPAPPSNSPLYNDTQLNREEILKEIEDVQHSTLIDHLLTTPVQNNQKVEEKKVIEDKKVVEEKKIIVDKKENQTPKPYAADPYREPLA